MRITLKEFPTHIAKSDNKYAANKMLKINNQAIYSGALNRFARAIVVNNMHEYIAGEILPFKNKFLQKGTRYPIKVKIEVHTTVNHGDISMRKGKICWKPAKSDYVPTWDIDNLATIWIKTLNDTLQKTGFIPNDHIGYLYGGGYEYHEVKDLKDRKLIIIIDE